MEGGGDCCGYRLYHTLQVVLHLESEAEKRDLGLPMEEQALANIHIRWKVCAE